MCGTGSQNIVAEVGIDWQVCTCCFSHHLFNYLDQPEGKDHAEQNTWDMWEKDPKTEPG